MNTQLFLQDLFDILRGYTFDEIYSSSFGVTAISHTDTSCYWNFCFIHSLINENQLSSIEKDMQSKKRQSAIYFIDSPPVNSIVPFLKARGYTKSNEDSYLFFEGTRNNFPDFLNVKKVETPEEFSLFLETADKCYIKNDPQGPYGELGEFIDTAKRAWENLHTSGKIECYIAYKDQTPVSVAILSSGHTIGYITLVGSLPSVRGEGFGKKITLFAVSRSIELGNKYHVLATEEGNYPHEFYKRIGFIPRFSAVCYVKHN